MLEWNDQIGGKFVNELVFIAFWILPVYELSAMADILVINSIEAEQVKDIFESYLKCESLVELETFVQTKGITHKHWITNKGVEKGGKPLKTSALHRLLHEKIYLGLIENKKT